MLPGIIILGVLAGGAALSNAYQASSKNDKAQTFCQLTKIKDNQVLDRDRVSGALRDLDAVDDMTQLIGPAFGRNVDIPEIQGQELPINLRIDQQAGKIAVSNACGEGYTDFIDVGHPLRDYQLARAYLSVIGNCNPALSCVNFPINATIEQMIQSYVDVAGKCGDTSAVARPVLGNYLLCDPNIIPVNETAITTNTIPFGTTASNSIGGEVALIAIPLGLGLLCMIAAAGGCCAVTIIGVRQYAEQNRNAENQPDNERTPLLEAAKSWVENYFGRQQQGHQEVAL